MMFGFDVAMVLLKDGHAVRRRVWQAGQVLKIIRGSQDTQNAMSYLALEITNKIIVPWQPTSDALLANDWVEAD